MVGWECSRDGVGWKCSRVGVEWIEVAILWNQIQFDFPLPTIRRLFSNGRNMFDVTYTARAQIKYKC